MKSYPQNNTMSSINALPCSKVGIHDHHLTNLGSSHIPNATYPGQNSIDTLDSEDIFEGIDRILSW